jgi:hypothetical protein
MSLASAKLGPCRGPSGPWGPPNTYGNFRIKRNRVKNKKFNNFFLYRVSLSATGYVSGMVFQKQITKKSVR